MKAVVFNLGCKVNDYECESIMRSLKDGGLEVSGQLSFADVYVLNTCAVTKEAERKSRQAVERCLKFNRDAKVYVRGCASQKDKEAFIDKNVFYVGGVFNKSDIPKLILSAIDFSGVVNDNSFLQKRQYEDDLFAINDKQRAFVKIEDGCDNFCSYCIIPYLRGRVRSRSIVGCVNEIKDASTRCNEVVLTGINVSAFGKDTGESLTELMRSIAKLNTDVNVRFGSLEVNVINEEFLSACKEVKGFCPHFHLSLQSGDDKTLKDMNRKYDTVAFKKAVDLIRGVFPFAAITTDIIVGYPTETDERFLNCYNFAKDIAFADIHVFPFSPREGTVAYKLKPLSKDVLKGRADKMNELKNELKQKFALSFVGKDVLFLAEKCEDGYFTGYTKEYVKVKVKGDFKEGQRYVITLQEENLVL